MVSTVKKERFAELDALRGIASLMVVFFHFIVPLYRNQPLLPIKYGMTGVNLFFMISGFVILMSTEHINNGKEFLVARFARIYPTYLWCMSLTMLLFCINKYRHLHEFPASGDWALYFANTSMMESFMNINFLDGPYWSLIYELMFYATVYLIYKAGKLAYLEHILACIVAFWGGVDLLSIYHPYNLTLQNISHWDQYYPLLNYLSLFLIGSAFYKIRIKGFTLFRCILVIVCYFAQLLGYHRLSGLITFSISQTEYGVILLVFIGLFVASISRIFKVLANQLLIFFGRISYALYLFHQYFCLSFLIPIFDTDFHWPHFLSLIIAFVFAVFVAWLNTKYVDEPMRKKIKLWLLPDRMKA